jgi:hypothetical protein
MPKEDQKPRHNNYSQGTKCQRANGSMNKNQDLKGKRTYEDDEAKIETRGNS